MAASTGKNLNNRAEEIIGNAVDLWTGYRENFFGYAVPRPFVGFLVLVEDLPQVNRAVRPAEPYQIFKKKTYAKRWNILPAVRTITITKLPFLTRVLGC
jgi:hypothetical protein